MNEQKLNITGFHGTDIKYATKIVSNEFIVKRSSEH